MISARVHKYLAATRDRPRGIHSVSICFSAGIAKANHFHCFESFNQGARDRCFERVGGPTQRMPMGHCPRDSIYYWLRREAKQPRSIVTQEV